MAKTSNYMKFLNHRTLEPKKQKFAVRHVNICRMCGRSRGYMRRFALCRICFRENAHKGNIPGVHKISW